MRYADAAAVAAGFRTLTDEEQARADALLEEAAVLIDAVAADAKEDAKWVVSCRMVRRVLGDGTGGDMPLYPMGASQGSATALGYTQSWTMSGGTSGELYISRTERRLLGAGNRILRGCGAAWRRAPAHCRLRMPARKSSTTCWARCRRTAT